MHDTTLICRTVPAPTTTDRYEAAVTTEILECGLSDEDDAEGELADTLHAIASGVPFLLHGEWLVATSGLDAGNICVISVERKDGQVQLRRWKLSVSLIYALLCEDAFAFPWPANMPPSNDVSGEHLGLVASHS